MRILLPICALFCACQPPPAPPKERCLETAAQTGVVMARIGEATLTVEQLADRIQGQGRAAVRRFASPVRARQYVEDQVRFELLVQAGLERGLQRDPDVIETAQKVMVRKLLLRDMGPEAFPTVSDKTIESYYRRHANEYVQPEKRRFADIQLAPTEDGRVLAMSLLEQIAKDPEDMGRFKMLVARHSLRKVIKTPGIAEIYKSRAQLIATFGPAFATEVFTAQTDSLIAKPVQSTQGWHVVKVLAVREALTRELDKVRDEIRDSLQRGQRSKLFEDYLSNLKQRHPIAIYDARIDELVAALNAPTTPSQGATP